MSVREKLRQGLAIPAHPLALTSDRKLDERRQRALTRYYLASGVGGIAVGVHTTQFAIRDPRIGLFRPVLELAAEEMKARTELKIAGVSGPTSQAITEAGLARSLEYDAALLSLGALRDATTTELIDHARAVAAIIPIVGFYLQPSVGGRVLPYEFWRRLTEIENLVAIKIAPFNRYQTIDVVRAVAESGRSGEIALYTGNDDNIIADLVSAFEVGGQRVRIVGGLLGHWAVWTRSAVDYFQAAREISQSEAPIPREFLTLGTQITDANAALFDPSHAFHGCIAGLHEILRRQGLFAGRWCLDPNEDLSPGQMEEIDRVCRLYRHLQDDEFVRENLDAWMR
ncbi:MAG TPA: dihydrodipicolinate synthase family protein [Bryobacteraceae bacterium]|jgi:dihydrodipicolinate synthase/N-acetylneuraminate lyase|nr:dihydrodipicolinate synthase family protein [Bryobacteraceae bacterium]